MNNQTTVRKYANVLISLLETGGTYDDKMYIAAARDASGQPFLVAANKAPIGFDVDEQGGLVFTNHKLNSAGKFHNDHTRPMRDVLNDYCQAAGLNNVLYLQCPPMEKAMTMAALANTTRQLEMHGNSLTQEEFQNAVAIDTLNTFTKVFETEPKMDIENNQLAQAMIAAGMIPVTGTDQESVSFVEETPTTPITESNIRHVEAGIVSTEAVEKTQTDDYSQSEELVALMRKRDDLSEVEVELVQRLERMIFRDRQKLARIKQIKETPQNSVEHSIGFLLNGPHIPSWMANSL